MSTPPSPVFVPVSLAEIRHETPQLAHLSLADAPPDLHAAYRVPGQYVQIREGDGKPGFFALASGPGQGKLEFLVKRGAPLADLLAAKKPGETLAISAPAGKGYPMAEARGRDVLLCGVGSGLAPLRAALHEILRERAAYKTVKLCYGVRKADGFPYAGELGAWLTHGVQVTRVCSQPDAGTWTGLTGHVQDILRQRGALAPDTCVLACGMKAMVEDLKAVLAELGVPKERVFQNF